MSYILDALKKSEQERKRGNVPDIKSIHSNDAPGDIGSSRNWWPVLIGVAVLFPVVATVVVLLPDSENVSPQSIATDRNIDQAVSANSSSISGSASTPAASSSIQNSRPELAARKNTGPAVTQAQKKPQPKVVFSDTVLDAESTEPASASAPAPINDIAVPVTEVPEAIRRQIPSISFAGHVYSSVSNRRSVMINGKKMREGEAVTAELILKEITPTGAEFTFQGYRFKLGALQDWSFQ